MAGRALFLRILRAVSESNLDADTRHVLMVMATYAESTTGIGLHSQGTIARLSGRSERHVRAILASLSAPDSSPVRVERRPRFRTDGRGRTSDEWRLILASDQPAHGAAYSSDQPAQHAGGSSGLTGTPRTTNRHATSDQPAPGAGDLRSDRRSDRRSPDSASTSEAAPPFVLEAPPSEPEPAKKPSKPPRKPKTVKSEDPEHGAKHAMVVATYHEHFEAKRGEKPVFDSRDGADVKKLLAKCGGDVEKACRAIVGAFVSWKSDTVTIRQIAANPSEFIGAKAPKTNGHRGPIQSREGAPDLEALYGAK